MWAENDELVQNQNSKVPHRKLQIVWLGSNSQIKFTKLKRDFSELCELAGKDKLLQNQETVNIHRILETVWAQI